MTREKKISALANLRYVKHWKDKNGLADETVDICIEALEQEQCYKELAESYEKTINKLTKVIAEQKPKEVIYKDEGCCIYSEIYKGKSCMPIDEETFRDEVLLFLEYFTRSELLNIVITAIEMHDSIDKK